MEKDFTKEARKIHYGETEKSIRGETTKEQAEELLDEGIELLDSMDFRCLKNETKD